MAEVHFDCDRCGQGVEGYVYSNCTAGYYDVRSEPWSLYARSGEERICDRCMWDDPAYISIYGRH